MEVGQGRVSVAQLDGGDAQRPDVAASVVGGVQLLLTGDDLPVKAETRRPAKTLTSADGEKHQIFTKERQHPSWC